MLAAIVMSTAVLFLSQTFPYDKFKTPLKHTILIIAVATLGMVTAMSPYMFTGLSVTNGNYEPIAGPGMIMFMISGLGYTLMGLGILVSKYLKSKGKTQLQIKYLLIGLGLMHVFLITANFVMVLVFKNSYFISFGPLFTLPFLIATAYTIVRHRLLEIRELVVKTIYFSVITALVIGSYAYALFLIPTFLPSAHQNTATVLFGLILVLTFNWLKQAIQEITEDIFHKKTYSSQKLLDELGEITSSTIDTKVLTQKVIDKLTETMHISSLSFMLIRQDDNKKEISTITSNQNFSPNLTIEQIEHLASRAKNNPLVFEDLEATPARKLMMDHKISIVLPLKVGSTLHGLILIGEKSSGDVYNNQDIDLLDIFTPQISVAIQNSLTFDQIKNFNTILKKEVENATLELKAANKNLKHLDKLKDEFVFVATHELKTPVTVMKGYLSMINAGEYGKVPEKISSALKEIDSANIQLVNLVNDLLQIARAEAKTLKVTTQPTLIVDIIKKDLNNLKTLADQKNLKLEYIEPEIENISVLSDPEKLQEILNNLVSNAIKYSDKGTITISHKLEKDSLITNVADQGLGISKENQDKIFTRFFRAQEVEGTPGTGLGLFIVKQLVEKMGGKIWFKSELGKGTTFSFSLPLAK